ncbi:extracellular solute-binding protein [Candidatus Bipolaricaulota bacterium]|nr:extracellular solute-binding protein [Candidatus Bipolaricaulota bacterium]
MKRTMIVAALFVLLTLFGTMAWAADLQFVTPAWQGNTVKEIKAIVREWNDAHPDIQVEILWQAWENLDDFMLTSFQAGVAPDVFHQDSVMCFEYGLMGYAEPLNDWLSSDLLTDTPDKNWANVSHDETIYGVPFLQETLVIFYNKALFEAAGITVPTDGLITWNQLLDYSQRLTQRNDQGTVTTWGLLAPVEQRLWWVLVEQNNGHVLVEHDDGTWHVEIDDNAREAIGFYTDLVTVHHVMPQDVLSYDFMTLLQGFKNGTYAMFSFGCWVRNWVTTITRGEIDWGMLQLEGPQRNVTEADPQAIGIHSGSDNKQDAAAFVEYFTSTENQIRLALADWLFPVRETALADPRFQVEEDEWALAYSWLEYAEDVKPQMFGFFAWEWQSFIPQMELVILGNQNLDAALEAATTQGNQFLRRTGLQ